MTHYSPSRLRRGAGLLLLSAALTLGCAQLLGLDQDVPAGPCSTDRQCAPNQRCESGSCRPSGGSGTGGSAGGSRSSGGASNLPGSAGLGGELAGSAGSAGNEESGAAGQRSGGAGGPGIPPECSSPADCAGRDNDCAQRTCVDGKCGVDYAKHGDLASVQVAGDCQKAICDGSGAFTTQADDDEVPDDGKVCTLDLCKNGVASHSFASTTTSCGASSQFKCDGMGVCGGCTQDADCGLNGLCATYSCVAGMCKNTFVGSGQGTLPNTVGDCRKNVCDGMGNPTVIADNADLPNDNNPCTKDQCSNGLPVFPPQSNTTSCGALSTCDGAGNCVCTDTKACDGKCGNLKDSCNHQRDCGNPCTGHDTCGGGSVANVCGCDSTPPDCGGSCSGKASNGCGDTISCVIPCMPPCKFSSICDCGVCTT